MYFRIEYLLTIVTSLAAGVRHLNSIDTKHLPDTIDIDRLAPTPEGGERLIESYRVRRNRHGKWARG